jgi:DNA-binding transcriptional LysR family regulator
LESKDLSLLLALDAILQERNVTKAGGRIGLSAPATSHALARIRELLDDPVLVRAGRKMVLTPRAESLLPRIRSLVEEAKGLGGCLGAIVQRPAPGSAVDVRAPR